MSFSSYFRKKLSNAVKIQDNINFIEKYRQINLHGKRSIPPRQYPLTRDTRLSDLAGRQGDDYTTPRRYRPNSDEVYYDVDWFKR